MAAFPEEPYGVAGFHQLRAPGFEGMAAPGFDYSTSDSESSLSTDSDASDSDDGSFTTTTTTRRTLNDDEDWWREGKAALDAAAAAAAPAEALAGAMREYGADPRLAVRGAHRLEAHYTSSRGMEGCTNATREASVVATELLGALRRADSSGASALQACAAACASSRPSGGAVFIDRLAAHGGLACVLETLSTHPDDGEVQRAGLGILGHARLLDREASVRLSAPRAVDAAFEALSRHQGDPKLVGLAALALYNAAHADMGAAATVAGECRLIVASLQGCEAESARAAGCWALGALAALEGLRESGERVSLAAAVKKAGAFELFAETLARFPLSSIAHRNATLARGQLRDALESPEPPLNAREQWPMFGTHCVMS